MKQARRRRPRICIEAEKSKHHEARQAVADPCSADVCWSPCGLRTRGDRMTRRETLKSWYIPEIQENKYCLFLSFPTSLFFCPFRLSASTISVRARMAMKVLGSNNVSVTNKTCFLYLDTKDAQDEEGDGTSGTALPFSIFHYSR